MQRPGPWNLYLSVTCPSLACLESRSCHLAWTRPPSRARAPRAEHASSSGDAWKAEE